MTLQTDQNDDDDLALAKPPPPPTPVVVVVPSQQLHRYSNHEAAVADDDDDDDAAVVVVVAATAAAATATAIVSASLATMSTDSTFYWDAPSEIDLQDRTLSTMELSALAGQKLKDKDMDDDDFVSNNIDNPGPHGATANVSHPYWEWKDGALDSLKRTLSKLSMSSLRRGSSREKREDNTEEGVDTAEVKAGVVTDGNNGGDNSIIPQIESRGGGYYWLWRNPSSTNLSLSTASLTALGGHRAAVVANDSNPDAADTTDAATTTTTTTSTKLPRRDSGTTTNGLYWFWRNPDMSNLGTTTVSNASLDTLEKKAKESERDNTDEAATLAGGGGGGNGGNGTATGPITNLQHKLRSSWRRSFQHLSTNSMTKLDEGAASSVDDDVCGSGSTAGPSSAAAKSGWREAFASRRRTSSITSNDNIDVDGYNTTLETPASAFLEEDEQDVGAITF